MTKMSLVIKQYNRVLIYYLRTQENDSFRHMIHSNVTQLSEVDV